MHRLNVTFFLPFFPPSPFSISRQIDRVFIETPAHVSACSANFSTEHRPDSAAETRVNIKKPFDSADNKYHARILIFNIAPEFQIQPSPVHPPSPSFRTSYLTYPRSHVLYFSIQGYYTLYTIILLLFFSLEEETTTLNSNRNSDCDQSDPPPLQIFRRRFGGTIKLTSAKCVSDLLCGRIYLHHCFPPGNPPLHSSVSLCCTHRSNLVTRTQLVPSFMDREYAIRSNLHRRAEFLSLSHSLFFVHLRKKRRRRGGFSQEYILYFSKSTINFYRLPGDGYGGRKKRRRRMEISIRFD